MKYNLLPKDERLLEFVKVYGNKARLVRGVVCLQETGGKLKYFAPRHFIPTIMHLCHDSKWSGHFGVEKTLHRIKEAWFWPDMITEITQYCRNCPRCLEVNNPHLLKPSPMEQEERANKFNYHIHIDLLTNLPISIATGNKHVLVVTCQYSKYTQFFPIKTKTAEEIATILLEKWIPLHSIPVIISSDLGKENHNKIISTLLNALGVEHIFSSVGYAKSNAEVEAKNRIFLNYCRKFLNHNEWEGLLPHLHFAYNTQIHGVTKFSPFFLAFNRHPVLPHHVVIQPPKLNYSDDDITQKLYMQHKVWQEVLRNSNRTFQKNKKYYDKKASSRQLKVGQSVYMKTPCPSNVYYKFHRPLSGPYTVVEVKSHNNYVLVGSDGKLITRNIEFLRAAPVKEQDSWLQLPMSTAFKQKTRKLNKNDNDQHTVGPAFLPPLAKTSLSENDEVEQQEEDNDSSDIFHEEAGGMDEVSVQDVSPQSPSSSHSRSNVSSQDQSTGPSTSQDTRFSYPRALTRLQSKVKKIPPVQFELPKRTRKKVMCEIYWETQWLSNDDKNLWVEQFCTCMCIANLQQQMHQGQRQGYIKRSSHTV